MRFRSGDFRIQIGALDDVRLDCGVQHAFAATDTRLARAFECHAAALERAARRMLPAAPDKADDLVQETFLRYLEASRRRACDEPSLPLLLWLLRRRVLDEVDACRRRPEPRSLEADDPVVLGQGKKLFPQGTAATRFEQIESPRLFSGGVVLMRCRCLEGPPETVNTAEAVNAEG